MVTFNLHVKNGTGGYSDYDACDLRLLGDITAEAIPRIGEKIVFPQKSKGVNVMRTFIVTDVSHNISVSYPLKKVSDITVYIVPVDGMPCLLES